MCIYCETGKYRKIYEQHHGPILKDADNRSYEIHHKDGNHINNHPDNLISVSIQEHYDIHLSRKDYGACFLLAQKMKFLPAQITEFNKLQNRKRIESGTHNLMRRPDGTSHASDKVKNLTHHFLKNGQPPKPKKIPTKKIGLIYNWKNTITGECETLSMAGLIRKYNLSAYQGNISQLVKGKFKTVKGWIIGI
jgi:hypothetical protein